MGIDAFGSWCGERDAANSARSKLSRGKAHDTLCFPDFPGATDSVGFRTNFIIEKYRDIAHELFSQAVQPLDISTKLRNVVELILKKLESIAAVEPLPDVVVIVLPAIVEQHCAAVGAIQ